MELSISLTSSSAVIERLAVLIAIPVAPFWMLEATEEGAVVSLAVDVEVLPTWTTAAQAELIQYINIR